MGALGSQGAKYEKRKHTLKPHQTYRVFNSGLPGLTTLSPTPPLLPSAPPPPPPDPMPDVSENDPILASLSSWHLWLKNNPWSKNPVGWWVMARLWQIQMERFKLRPMQFFAGLKGSCSSFQAWWRSTWQSVEIFPLVCTSHTDLLPSRPWECHWPQYSVNLRPFIFDSNKNSPHFATFFQASWSLVFSLPYATLAFRPATPAFLALRRLESASTQSNSGEFKNSRIDSKISTPQDWKKIASQDSLHGTSPKSWHTIWFLMIFASTFDSGNLQSPHVYQQQPQD